MMATGRVAAAIEQSILAQDFAQTHVTCPARVPVKAGYRFTCHAALPVGSYPMYVTEQGTHGETIYSDATPLRTLDTQTIERGIQAAIKKRRHVTSTVVCPGPVLQAAGLKFTCLATYRGGHTTFHVTETDGLGHVTSVGG
jgi:hypothetical protein